MRANISNELINAIDERIYLDLELHVLTKKMNEAEKQGNEGFSKHLDNLIQNTIKQRKQTQDYLVKNGIKIFDVVEDDDKEFVEYPYYQKVNGGYKEGTMRYWRHAIRYKLKQRMSKYL
ncbi:hypothetical protein [Bacillus sp. T33-2]|uniref:hypothetical protein n=1 Tax=Bacillus sp. T33-2 TaxID=2054168 RepID=UPI000C78D6D6|nr:hypothetical protein [Bacillus sp. T33-2]PLR99499.1 hypothetical protein CVD19_00110 [Bacillus sp. T33-2]